MINEPVIRVYCRQVNKALELPKAQRDRLLDGMAQELEERFASGADVTWEELCASVGTPEESAAALMESVDAGERIRYRTRRKRAVCCVMAALALLIALMTVYIIHGAQYEIDHTKVTIIQYEDRSIE